MATSQKDLRDLLEHGLKDIYYAENAIYKALPKMVEGSSDAGLKDGLSTHREETGRHVTDLEKVFDDLGMKAESEKCDAIDGILKEGEKLLKDFRRHAVGRRGDHLRLPGGRALRDRTLWQPAHLCRTAGPGSGSPNC